MGKLKEACRAFVQAYNGRGEEVPDPTPVAVPVGFKRPPTIHEQLKAMVRSEQWRAQMEARGAESFEEANDFEIEDDGLDDVPTVAEMHEELLDSARRDADRAISERMKNGRRNSEEVDEGGRAGDRLDAEPRGEDVRAQQGSRSVRERARGAGEGHSGVSRRSGEDQNRLEE